jgi:hypothetical protein
MQPQALAIMYQVKLLYTNLSDLEYYS